MSTPISVEFVVEVHDQILLETRVGRAGLDRGKLEGALGRIDQHIYYNQVDDVFVLGAWYAIAIAKGHAFVDANKRTGLAVMLTYLEIQGITIGHDTGLDDVMVDVVESTLPAELLAQALADYMAQLVV